jgi:alpha-beta hydrolase superfamily lysophospholipase
MVIESYQIYSGGSVQLFCSSWQPEETPKAVLLLVHGLGEHLGRYEEMATKLANQGIAVFAYDHRGHGQSDGKKGHAQSIDQFVEDLEHAMMKCRSIFLETPIFLYGHSMGGQIVAAYLDKVQSKEVSGIIISSPWILLNNAPPPWQVKLVRVLSRIFPTLTLPNGLDPEQISSVKDEVDQYVDDPLVHNRISFALFSSLFAKGVALHHYAQPCRIPVLVCHGTGDQITSARASAKYAGHLGAKAIFKSWEKSKHEPHHDFEKDQVIQFYIDWIRSQLA